MEYRVFIHTNNKQILGAHLAKFAIERKLADPSKVRVNFINVDELPEFKAFAGVEYLRKGQPTIYDPNDLQSFTLSRFMPPELSGYMGRSMVLDPDIFAIGDVTELLSMDLGESALGACRKADAWDTSVMVMDNAKLRHWKIAAFLGALRDKKLDYVDLMSLKKEPSIYELPRIWNSLDRLTSETKMLHTTNRLTQPWRTGLPIDFVRNPMPKLFGLPREPFMKLIGKYPNTYQPHPDKNIEKFFFTLLKEALATGAVKESLVKDEIEKGHVRKDAFEMLQRA